MALYLERAYSGGYYRSAVVVCSRRWPWGLASWVYYCMILLPYAELRRTGRRSPPIVMLISPVWVVSSCGAGCSTYGAPGSCDRVKFPLFFSAHAAAALAPGCFRYFDLASNPNLA